MTTRLNPLDTAWVFTESRATPNHVGGLLQFRLPDDAPEDFLRQMMADFRDHLDFSPPWNRRLRFPFTKNPLPSWVEDKEIDLEYHVRHAALPWPGGERELGELIGLLQSTPLDLSRPPWECTIIEGLEGNRFAIFIKIHHSLVDGVSGMMLLQRAMSTDPEESLVLPPFWAMGEGQQRARYRGARRRRAKRVAGPAPTMANVMASAIGGLSAQVRTLPQLVAAFAKILRRIGAAEEGMAIPFDTPRSMLNGRVREKRRFATQQFPMERLRALAVAGQCTLNDIVLTVCGGALRKYLLERDSLPDKPLIAGIPVSVRPSDDQGSGNAISFIVATLATDVDTPIARLAAIKASVQHGKDHIRSLPKKAMMQYTVLLMAPTIVTLLTGVGGRTRPMFNVTISNVPGPEQPLYFRGAELVAVYPVSIVTHGQALNITCESYAGLMNFGFTGCHTAVPSMQKIAVYAADAVTELENALLPPKRKRRTKRAAPGAGA
ncbi:MAG: WS/DGAT/MGAT family O-acyltransferase [Gammaproteobacteria bacterium]